MNIRFNRPVQANPLTSILDDFFQKGFNELTNTHVSFNRPSVNIIEQDESFEVQLAAPGLKKEDFEIKVDDGVLSIQVEKTGEQVETKEGYTRREYKTRNFLRRFTLPEAADDTAINATFANGILTVSLPKKEEAKPQPARLIEVAG